MFEDGSFCPRLELHHPYLLQGRQNTQRPVGITCSSWTQPVLSTWTCSSGAGPDKQAEVQLLLRTALALQTRSHRSHFPTQLMEKQDPTAALQLHPCCQAGRGSRSLPKHEPTSADAGYLHFSTANKNKLLLKCGAGRETGFTSFEQSVLAKDISGGRKKPCWSLH